MLSLIFAAAAFATAGFDPAAPAAVYTDAQVMSHDGQRQLWSRVERHADPDRVLFQAEEFNAVFRWSDSEFTPHMRTMFGGQTPHSSTFLLHMGPGEPSASGTPVLYVHGAGDNASRSTFALRAQIEGMGRPFYAITFAHPHGDVLMQAEAVANAIEVIKHRTGEARVDVIAHSKGGPAVLTYLSHHDGADWGHAAYEAVGTTYRGDVRRAVMVGVPLDGIDTAYRWPASNFFGLDADQAVAPVSWSTHYPYGAGTWWINSDLSEQDFFADGGDPFPGQRQLLKRQPHTLPGMLPWLGGFALQTDWYTTYEGGFGFFSHSWGIDDAIEAGGHFVDTLAAQGVDPSVELYILAGTNPMMPNGDPAFEEVWDGVASASQWSMLLNSISSFVTPIASTAAERQGLAAGKLVLGEVSGASDGVVFLSSALAEDAISARGASFTDVAVVELSHTELLLASPAMGAMMHALAGDDPESAWMIDRGDRYTSVDALGWISDKLVDPPDFGSAAAGRGALDDVDAAAAEDQWGAIGGCTHTGSVPLALGLVPMLLLGLRRRG